MKIDLKGIFLKTKLSVIEHAPELLIIGGVAGMIGSAILACAATRKLDPVLEQHKDSVEAVHKMVEADAQKKELTRVYTRTALELVKLYAPSMTLCALSATGILAGTHVFRKRSVALAAAYNAVDTSFKEYRNRVIDKFGEQVDEELKIGTHKQEVELEEVDENGEVKKVIHEIDIADEGLPSEYARYFMYGESCCAEKNNDYNARFLKTINTIVNDRLRANGFMFLNDVYEELGYSKTIAGQSVGWVYDPDRDDHGDNYIDFGMRSVYIQSKDHPDKFEQAFLLDFNVDGVIFAHAKTRGLMTNV